MYSRKWKISFCENWRRKNIHGRWWCCLVVEQISNQRQHLAVAQNVCPLQIWTVLKLWYWGNILKVIILRKYIETSLQNDSIVVLSIQTGLTLLRSAKCIVFERDMLCSLNSNVCTFPQHSKLSDLSGQVETRPTRKLHHTDMQAWPGLGDGRAHSLKASVPHSFPVGSSHLTNQTKADRRRNMRKIVILCVFNKGSSYVDYYLVDDLKYFSAGYIHGSGRGKWKWQGADWRRVMG